jgi:hypothetical protein
MVIMAFLALFGAILMLVATALAVYFVTEYARGRAAMGWPTAAGTVTGPRIDETRELRGGFTYTPVILYRYAVDGLDYNGNRVAFGKTRGPHSAAEKVLQSYPVGSAIEVHYNLGRPQESVLQSGPNASYLVGNLVGASLLFGLGCFILWQAWSH